MWSILHFDYDDLESEKEKTARNQRCQNILGLNDIIWIHEKTLTEEKLPEQNPPSEKSYIFCAIENSGCFAISSYFSSWKISAPNHRRERPSSIVELIRCVSSEERNILRCDVEKQPGGLQ